VSVLFGLVTAVIASIAAAGVVAMLGFRDGDRPGDARVTVRVVRGDGGAVAGPCAEIVVDNRHDSPVLVSARARRASVLALVFAAPLAQHTALTHRRRLGGVDVLGAVDGCGIRRYLLPLRPGRSATKVTVFVDQVARRTRVATATLRLGGSLPGPLPWPTAQPTERELP